VCYYSPNPQDALDEKSLLPFSQVEDIENGWKTNKIVFTI